MDFIAQGMHTTSTKLYICKISYHSQPTIYEDITSTQVKIEQKASLD